MQGGALYHYGTSNSQCTGASSAAAGPHAVSRIGTQRYCYDAMGNQTHQYQGSTLVRRIHYNAIGKARRIQSFTSESESGRSAGITEFMYDASRNQVRRTSTEQGKTTTITQHGVAELISEGGESWFRRNLGNAIVELRRGEQGGDSVTTRYVYTDHLGSVDVITDDAGQVEEKLSFDAFGKRRAVFKSNNQAVNFTLASILSLTHKGYTGHEQVDHASVVQMGGRIYDAHIGRFLQADPFVQSPSNSQNFNRYSYVLNNPLSYTDPSGYLFKKLASPFKRVIRGVFKALGADISQTIVSIGSLFCGPWAPACSAAGTYNVARAHGASSSQALRGAAVAGASTWAFTPSGGPAAPTASQVTVRLGINIVAAHNPNMGQALMYISGSLGKDFGGWVQNAVGSYGQYKAQSELTRFAAKNGLSLQELNLILGLNSKLGLAIAGSTYDKNAQTVTGFTTRSGELLGNWSGRIGVLWDINDTLLNAQGLLDAVSLQVINLGHTGHLTGHSLGAWRVNNLVRQGFVESGTLFALPGFAYPAAGTQGACVSTDPVCGGGLLNPLRVGTMHFPKPNSIWDSHNFDEYVRQWQQRKH
ncbi:hypothetical protein CWE08_11890 [Aliidiomarina iranensis]|uniref:Teneurin-like YD-shell domain-containing protein n=1 Tax=Aliidiomarina iranensis TaxID=1434071 RepID=A0A432VPU1_9GAMM|nr:RHS repeat-associated core domain-containing protein [Aliidiomarina iranensis]RUO18180.1 hypothetical protein CWE08_11890 [Aliidiomarina iranensis]